MKIERQKEEERLRYISRTSLLTPYQDGEP